MDNVNAARQIRSAVMGFSAGWAKWGKMREKANYKSPSIIVKATLARNQTAGIARVSVAGQNC
jgi:hypothetical protein